MENEVLARLLEKDELLLWSGKPAPFKILDKDSKPVFIRNYSITILVVAAVLIAAVVASMRGHSLNFSALFVILCIPLVVVPLRLFSYRGYRSKCRYFVTNKSIIVYISEYQKLRFPLSSIDTFESIPQDEGTRSVRIGKAVGIPLRKNREYALNCITGHTGDDSNKGCLLYNLAEKDAITVLELIDKYRVVA